MKHLLQISILALGLFVTACNTNAQQPAVVEPFGLDPDNVMKYNFEDAKANTSKYVQDFFNALGAAADSRFKTE